MEEVVKDSKKSRAGLSELAELARILDEQLRVAEEDKLSLYEPHAGQKEFHSSEHKIRCMFTGNRFGKSLASVIEAIWLCLGVHPYRRRQLRLPVKGKMYADSFPMLMETMRPKFEEWLHVKYLDKKKPYLYNQMGHLIGINFANGSRLSFGSYDQEERKAEGSAWDFVAFDEPPSRTMYIANLRGLVDSGGLMWFTCTPISSAWMYNDLYEPSITGEKKYIKIITGNSYDNPHINRGALDVYFGELTEAERRVRIEGSFVSVSGKVLNTIDYGLSVIDDFNLDGRYVVYEGLDPHSSKPNRGLWKAVDEEGHRFVVRELIHDGGTYDFGVEISRVRDEIRCQGTTIVGSVIDTSINQKDMLKKVNQYETLKQALQDCREHLMPKLADKKGWLMGGIERLKDLYRLVTQHSKDFYDRMGYDVNTKLPMEYIFCSCKSYILETKNYVWSDDIEKENVKPVGKFDDLISCSRYIETLAPSYVTRGAAMVRYADKNAYRRQRK